MLVFVTSDKGGTGRSVTSSNIVYRTALRGRSACYVDFDFGSPTAGAIFNIPDALNGTAENGVHSFLMGKVSAARQIDVWESSDRRSLQIRPAGAEALAFVPGDLGGSEFPGNGDIYRRCGDLLRLLDEQFDLTLIDLSAGRSYATEIVLAATAMPGCAEIPTRWLMFHRWTRQHVLAAASLVYGKEGILATGERHGHDPEKLSDALRFVRTAVINPNAEELTGLRAAQIAFLRECDRDLIELASRRKIGRSRLLGIVPMDPLLQWREQLISNTDIYDRRIGNLQTVAAFERLADDLLDDAAWGVV